MIKNTFVAVPHLAGTEPAQENIMRSKKWLAASGAMLVLVLSGCVCTSSKPAPRAAAAPVAMADSDHDGVADAYDRCPGTARGLAVDEHGCAIISQVVLVDLNFETGSWKLRPAAHDKLSSVAAAMNANEHLKILVAGHTDSVGTDAYNQTLSERRANSAKNFLVKKQGIRADRIETKGYGESTPVDTNDTTAGRANNRRVEFKVMED